MRVAPKFLPIDAWREVQPEKLFWSEAIQRLVNETLKAKQSQEGKHAQVTIKAQATDSLTQHLSNPKIAFLRPHANTSHNIDRGSESAEKFAVSVVTLIAVVAGWQLLLQA